MVVILTSMWDRSQLWMDVGGVESSSTASDACRPYCGRQAVLTVGSGEESGIEEEMMSLFCWTQVSVSLK